MKNNNLFYDMSKVMSYDALFNFINGSRGVGKTFAFKKWAITSKGECVWVRRNENDIFGTKGLLNGDGIKFYNDLLFEKAIPEDTVFNLVGNILYVNDEPKIYFIALSTASKLKSQSFPYVDKIIYDEYLIEESSIGKRYLKGEVDLFLGLYETVNRLRIDGRKDVKAFFLGNLSSFVNPYFAYFKINPFEGTHKLLANGNICVENYRNKAFEEKKIESRFGQLIKDKDIGRYMISNEQWKDDYNFVTKRSKNSILRFNIKYNGMIIGFWTDGFMFCSFDIDKNKTTYTTIFEMEEGTRPLIKTYYPMKTILECHKRGLLRFDNLTIKEIVYELMQVVK